MKKWLIFLMVLVITFLVIAGFWLRPSKVTVNSGVPGLTTTENNAIASKWARDLLEKYPHVVGSYSGVEPTKTLIEVWLIGQKIEEGSDPKMIALKNKNGRYIAKLIDTPIFTKQAGDVFDDRIPAETATLKEMKTGDYIAVRATYLDNGILALEVRKLARE